MKKKTVAFAVEFWVPYIIIATLINFTIFVSGGNIIFAFIVLGFSVLIPVLSAFLFAENVFYKITIDKKGLEYKVLKKRIFINWQDIELVKLEKNKRSLFSSSKFALSFYAKDIVIKIPFKKTAYVFVILFDKFCENEDIKKDVYYILNNLDYFKKQATYNDKRQ